MMPAGGAGLSKEDLFILLLTEAVIMEDQTVLHLREPCI